MDTTDKFPFTLEETVDICEDFEDLIDTDYTLNKSHDYFIQNVVTCPYAESDRNTFIENYDRSKNADESISFYTGNEYDVIVFAYDIDDESNFLVLDIRSYVDIQGINYHFPGQPRMGHEH